MITNDESKRGKDTTKEVFELRAADGNLFCGAFDHYPTQEEIIKAMWAHRRPAVQVQKTSYLMRWSEAQDAHVPVFSAPEIEQYEHMFAKYEATELRQAPNYMAQGEAAVRQFSDTMITYAAVKSLHGEMITETAGGAANGRFEDTHTHRALQEMNDTLPTVPPAPTPKTYYEGLTEDAAVPAGTPFFGKGSSWSPEQELRRKIQGHTKAVGFPPAIIVLGHVAYDELYAEITKPYPDKKIAGKLTHYRGIPVTQVSVNDDHIPGNAIYVSG
jgi:hypothetical protein